MFKKLCLSLIFDTLHISGLLKIPSSPLDYIHKFPLAIYPVKLPSHSLPKEYKKSDAIPPEGCSHVSRIPSPSYPHSITLSSGWRHSFCP